MHLKLYGTLFDTLLIHKEGAIPDTVSYDVKFNSPVNVEKTHGQEQWNTAYYLYYGKMIWYVIRKK